MELSAAAARPCRAGTLKGALKAATGVGRPIQVLLVEDSPEAAELVKVYLSEDGAASFRVEWACNLVEAMTRLARPGLDVVLLDLGLPELSSYKSYRAIDVAAGPQLPVVILAMWTVRPSGRELDVLMTNDALETHAVDSVRLLAAPRPPGGRVLRAGNAYFPASGAIAPTICTSPLGDCAADVAAVDEREYLSPASATDLAEKETIELAFPRPAQTGRDLGLLIAARNSLLNTFVFYQGLAYMGRKAGDWFARLEQADLGAQGFKAFGGLLGDVDVEVETARGWEKAGAFSEVGPIAKEVQLVPLPRGLDGAEVRVRLTLARGNWKIDRLALVELGAPVVPVPIEPSRVTKDGHPAPDARARLVDPRAHLVTFPGDAYRLTFPLPEGDSELFLESRGYYYEWIREEWLKEESAPEVGRILLDPEGAMRRLAPKYKAIEGDMERIFWQSRFGRRP